jgi:Zn finger protein HypA/HybF involved in hydrogenase expression
MPAEPEVVICPCCASVQDADAAPQAQDFECDRCGQQWQMVVDADRMAKYALT